MVGLVAFFLKGVTGTGTTTVIVALGSLIIEPKLTVVLASFINIFGGLSMLRVDPVPLSGRYWMPISLLMVVGSILGAVTLKYVPNQQFQLVLGAAFLLTALWFLFRAPPSRSDSGPPASARPMDLGIGTLAGFCGGFIGINAPPLVLHFSRYLDKRTMRRLLVLIFIPAAIAQTATFVVNGLFEKRMLVWGLLVIPTMILGVYLGNHTFHRISESWFRRALGLFLVFVSVRLILKGVV
ncbi:sulfite exporter TauE/SafE family protein [Desulfosarcina ovata]|uniref:sulfite exporter TauE/SafE family protein n=1 Tax=Desulfosarcina ovata TaxID=83564 RepID=UPI0022B11318|nr:sulfite exporter TauE/SafE family protein [Desulfosarcina ovata]